LLEFAAAAASNGRARMGVGMAAETGVMMVVGIADVGMLLGMSEPRTNAFVSCSEGILRK